MKIKVRLLSDPNPQTYTLPADSLITDLKVQIEKQTEISSAQQRLIFSGKILTDGKLKDVGVVEGVVLQMVLALRGG